MISRLQDYAQNAIREITGQINVGQNFIKTGLPCQETGIGAWLGPEKQCGHLECSSLCLPSSTSRKQSVHDLLPATSGSAALDIPALENLVVMPSMGIYKIPTDIWGPLPKNTVDLIIRRRWFKGDLRVLHLLCTLFLLFYLRPSGLRSQRLRTPAFAHHLGRDPAAPLVTAGVGSPSPIHVGPGDAP